MNDGAFSVDNTSVKRRMGLYLLNSLVATAVLLLTAPTGGFPNFVLVMFVFVMVLVNVF